MAIGTSALVALCKSSAINPLILLTAPGLHSYLQFKSLRLRGYLAQNDTTVGDRAGRKPQSVCDCVTECWGAACPAPQKMVASNEGNDVLKSGILAEQIKASAHFLVADAGRSI